MPFTVSHAAAALPFLGGRGGPRLVPAALVIGTMVPDVPYFVPPHRGAGWTHAWFGPFTVDLVLGLALYLLWALLLRRPLADLAPAVLRTRLSTAPPLTARRLAIAAVSVVLGAVTHVVWDTFTHPRRWGTTHVAALQDRLGPLPAYKWFQYGSGVLGLAVLATWLVLWLRRTPSRSGARQATHGQQVVATTVVAVTFVVSVTALALTGPVRLESALFRLATGSMAATAVAVLLVCVVWSVLVPTRDADRTLGRPRRPVGSSEESTRES